jgi:hypothetical protein
VATVTITVVAGPSPVIPPSKGTIPTAPPVVIPVSKGPVVAPPAPLVKTAAVFAPLKLSALAAAPAVAVSTPAIVTPAAAPIVAGVPAVDAKAVTAERLQVTSAIMLPASVPVVPQPDLAALMLPPVPAVQRLEAALKSLLDTATAPKLDAIFFDPITGSMESGGTAADSGADWLLFDPATVLKHRRIHWDART